jgi:hypothetical protein
LWLEYAKVSGPQPDRGQNQQREEAAGRPKQGSFNSHYLCREMASVSSLAAIQNGSQTGKRKWAHSGHSIEHSLLVVQKACTISSYG